MYKIYLWGYSGTGETIDKSVFLGMVTPTTYNPMELECTWIRPEYELADEEREGLGGRLIKPQRIRRTFKIESKWYKIPEFEYIDTCLFTLGTYKYWYLIIDKYELVNNDMYANLDDTAFCVSGEWEIEHETGYKRLKLTLKQVEVSQ